MKGLRLLLLFIIISLSAFAQGEYTWTGAISQDWQTAGNWSPEGIPGISDTVILNSKTIQINTGSTVRLGGFRFNNGIVICYDTVSVSGVMTWFNGTWTGTGTVNIGQNAELTINGSTTLTFNEGVIHNQGTINFIGTRDLVMGTGSKLNNYGLVSLANNSKISRGAGTGPVLNNFPGGVIRKSNANTTSVINYNTTLNNEGQILIEEGLMEIYANGYHSGRLEVTSGRLLKLGMGVQDWTTASELISDGPLEIVWTTGGSTITFGGSLSVYGKSSFLGGTTILSGPDISLGDTVIIDRGTIEFYGSDFDIKNLTIKSGTIKGTSKLNVSNYFEWLTGTITGTGTIEIMDGAGGILTGTSSKTLDMWTLNNRGTLLWDNTGTVIMSSGAVMNNDGLFEIRGNATLYRGVSTLPSVNNMPGGRIVKDFSNGLTTFNPSINILNEGSIEVLTGSLKLGSSLVNTGKFKIADTAIVEFPAGGPARFDQGSIMEIDGKVIISGSQVFFNTDYVLPPGIMLTNNGSIGGTGMLTVTDTLLWTGGNIFEAGEMIVDTTGVIVVSGNSNWKRFWQRKVKNYGKIYINGPYFGITANTEFFNHGFFEVKGPYSVKGVAQPSGGGGFVPVFYNMEDARFMSISNTSTNKYSGINFDNRGFIGITSGSFEIVPDMVGGNFVQNWGETALDNGNITSTRELLIKGGSLTGAGAISASLKNSGIIDPGFGEGQFGILTMQELTQDTSGILKFDIGGRSPGTGYDQVKADICNLDGTIDVKIGADFEPLPADKYRIIATLAESLNGTADTIAGLSYGNGKILEPVYTPNFLSLFGEEAEHDISVSIDGPSNYRPGQRMYFNIKCNSYNRKGGHFVLLLGLPSGFNIDFIKPPRDLPDIEWDYPDGPSDFRRLVPQGFEDEDGNMIIPLVMYLPGTESDPDNSVDFGISLQAPGSCKPNSNNDMLTAMVAWLEDEKTQDCLTGMVEYLVGFLPYGDCIGIGISAGKAARGTVTLSAFMADNAWPAAKCAADILGISFVPKFAKLMEDMYNGLETANKCSLALMPGDDAVGMRRGLSCVVSKDPNEKSGQGTTEGYISGRNELSYTISFENISSATAPAQRVVIYDILDPVLWETESFSFGTVRIADTLLKPGNGNSDFYQRFDLKKKTGYFVDVSGDFDSHTGVISWEFTTIDTITLQPVTDALSGFLPPNVTEPEGEGFVSFSILPNQDLSTGTEIKNKAEIIFDNNDPIITNEWVSYIDRTAPVSVVIGYNSEQADDNIIVKWHADDDLSGVSGVSLFVSRDGEDFKKNGFHTDSVVSFYGSPCSTYRFYTLALDSAGNREIHPGNIAEIRINPYYGAAISSDGGELICSGDSVFLNVPYWAEATYQWSLDNVPVPGSDTSGLAVKLPGIYSVKIENSYGCSFTAEGKKIFFTDPLQVDITAVGDTLSTNTDGIFYQWFFNGEAVTSGNTRKLVAQSNGEYFVSVTGVNGCSGLSSVINHHMTKLDDLTGRPLLVYPNPARDFLNVVDDEATGGETEILIADLNGRLLLHRSLNQVQGSRILEISLNGIPAGTYLITIKKSAKSTSLRFIKEI